MTDPTPLHTRACTHQAGPALAAPQWAALLPQVKGWAVDVPPQGLPALCKTFTFPDFHHTMAFVNAVAWIAHGQDHHPDMAVSYNRCELRWNTHSAGGLTLNDFICAARVEALSS